MKILIIGYIAGRVFNNYRYSDGLYRGLVMANYSDNITIESTPSGALMPSWLQEAVCQGEYRNLLVLYPSESSRQTKLTELSRINSSIDSSRHLTIKRLIRALLTDFRQPNAIEDDSILLFETHQECVTRAAKGKFASVFRSLAPLRPKGLTVHPYIVFYLYR